METWITYISVVLVLVVLVFIWQKRLCGSQCTMIRKLLPMALLLPGSAICAGICWYLNDKDQTLIFVLVFLLGLVLTVMMIGSALAWVTFGLVRYIQNRRK